MLSYVGREIARTVHRTSRNKRSRKQRGSRIGPGEGHTYNHRGKDRNEKGFLHNPLNFCRHSVFTDVAAQSVRHPALFQDKWVARDGAHGECDPALITLCRLTGVPHARTQFPDSRGNDCGAGTVLQRGTRSGSHSGLEPWQR
jgi:hypothetical protein